MKQGTKDLIGIIVPSLQLLMLGILTALITANLDRFKAGIDENNMINELVKDLSKDSTKMNLKYDFMMLSLERYLKRSHNGELKEYDRDMLVGFAKSVIINRLSSNSKTYDLKTNDVLIPKEILQKYDSSNIKSFLLAISEVNMTPTKRDTSEVRNIANVEPVRQLLNPQKSVLLNALIPKSIYIQYNNLSKKKEVDSIRIAFQKKGWNAPRVEYRKGVYKNSIRYFHPEDVLLVEEASNLIDTIQDHHFKKIFLSNYKDVPKGQIELWINNK